MSDERETLLITREALDNFYEWITAAQRTRAILQDLIAELREMGGEYDSGWEPLIAVADRAEARLREVGDE